MIPKSEKATEDPASYQPISLFSIVPEVLERVLQKELSLIMAEENLLFDIQFGFRTKHSIIEKIRRIVNPANQSS